MTSQQGGLLIQSRSGDVIRAPPLGFCAQRGCCTRPCVFQRERYLIARRGSRCSRFRTTSAGTEAAQAKVTYTLLSSLLSWRKETGLFCCVVFFFLLGVTVC